MYSNVVLGVKGHLFEEIIDNYKLTKGVLSDTELDDKDWDGVIKSFKDLIKEKTKKKLSTRCLSSTFWGNQCCIFILGGSASKNL